MNPPELRPIIGFPRYAVAEDRSVWSRRGGGLWHRLAPCRDGEGRVRVRLCRDGKPCLRYVAKLWRDAWGPDAMVPGKHPTGRVVGEKHGRSKLTEAQVIEARKLRAAGWTERALARRFGVSPSGMHYALAGKSWGHVS